MPKLPVEVEDEYFAKEEKDAKSGEAKFFDASKSKSETSEKRKADQAAVDKALAGAVSDPLLSAYLKAKFSLKKGDKPHLMKF